MKKNFILSCLFFSAFFTNAQVNFDSLDKVIDTVPIIKKKIDRYYFASSDRKLGTLEFNKFKQKLMDLSKNSKNRADVAHSHLRVGWLYYYQFNYNEALVEFFEYLKIAEEIKDSSIIAYAHSEIGDNYLRMKNDVYAVMHIHYAMQFANKTKKEDQKVLNDSYNYLADIYVHKGNYDSALKYCLLRLELNQKRKNKLIIARSHTALANVLIKQKKYDDALQNLEKALEIQTEIKDKKGAASSYMGKGEILMAQNNFEKAKEAFIKSVELAYYSRNSSKYYLDAIYKLSQCYFKMGDYKNASINFIKYKNTGDSLILQETDQKLAELSAIYEANKKDAELSLKEEQIKTSTAENSKQRILIAGSTIALLASLLAIFFVYRSFKLSKKNAIQLAFKNEVIEEKNKEITDSINYAKLIQQSLLASKEMLDKNLGNDYFILYKPKDIVSGDFYWAAELPTRFLIAAVDCTGHGVPGAFMSLIGKENLDKALAKFQKPGEILSELNRGVKKSLNQNNNSSKDGMDAALVSITKVGEQSKINYAGANRPLLVVKKTDNTLSEIKATKQAVGGFTADGQIFEEHELLLGKGDMVYICTDGFADQFGSDNNKKMTTKRFKEVLSSICTQPCAKQKQELEEFFTKWKGATEQLDDLLVIGIRV